MGEMADFYVDQMMDASPEWGSPYSRPRAEYVTCRNCGKRKLLWALNENRKYVLVSATTGAQHVCSPVCEFEDLTKDDK